ncbi:LysR family transcriptional regulator [Marimonas sp. MJW-29]|uniref:LysR family transcriptional regulator n=1 Tax=Sulfitobacter sediminis TaxID=3234186 RepID=A0ABV3RHI0_9RHOB
MKSPFVPIVFPPYSAEMQSFDWNDLKYFLCLHRAGNLAAAGRRLGVSDTTVARRIRALEAALGVPLFLRSGQGRHVLTPAGQNALARAEAIEREGAGLAEALGADGGGVAGTVTVSAVPLLCHHVLLPALPMLQARHPQVVLEIVPEARNLDLSKREADLALRFSRPASGGLRVRARKLGTVEFGVFAVAGGADLPWIAYADTAASLPQARWTSSALSRAGGAAPLRVTDAETALGAAALGLGKAVLPTKVAERDGRLVRVEGRWHAPLPQRDVWLLSHVDQAERRAIGAVKAWLSEIEW